MLTISQEYDYLFKCIAVGDGGCGKTALTVRFAHGFFQEQYKMTIGVEFAVKLIEIAGYKTKLQIWDTGGQERFSYVRPLYYRGAMGALLVFDLTNRESFEHLANWIDEVRSNIGEIPMVLVGNKSDLPGREVPRAECEGFSKKFNMYYLESSAKTGDGVTDCFGVLAAMMIGIAPPAELLGGKPATEQVAAVPSPTQPFVNASFGENHPVPSPAFPVGKQRLEEVEFAAPPVPEPVARIAPVNAVAPAKQDFIAPSMPEPQKVDEYAAPPIPEPCADRTKFIPLEKLLTGKAAPVKNAVPPPLVFQPPPLEVFEEGSEEKPPATIPFSQPSTVAKPVTFDTEIEESFPPVPTPPLPTTSQPQTRQLAIKPPVEGAIKAAPIGSQAGGSKKTSLLAFMPKMEETGKTGSTEAGKPKARRSAIPFLSASKIAPKKGSGFIPFASAGSAKTGSEAGSHPKFMSVFIPTVDQIKKGQTSTSGTKVVASFFPLASTPPPAPGPNIAQPPIQAASPKDAMIVCPNCGHKLSAAYKFCNRCGARVKK